MGSDGDYLRKVLPGETLRSIPRDAYNSFVDAARGFRRGEGGDGTPTFSRSPNLVTVRNQSGRDVDRFGVLELTQPAIGPDDNLDEFLRVVNFDGVIPSGGNHPFCILLEPLAGGAVGKGVINGIVPVLINGHGSCALPAHGDTTALLAGTSGVRVEYSEPGSGSGPRWAYVNLPAVCGTGTSVFGAPARLKYICNDDGDLVVILFDPTTGKVTSARTHPGCCPLLTGSGTGPGPGINCYLLDMVLVLSIRAGDDVDPFVGACAGLIGGAGAYCLPLTNRTLNSLWDPDDEGPIIWLLEGTGPFEYIRVTWEAGVWQVEVQHLASGPDAPGYYTDLYQHNDDLTDFPPCFLPVELDLGYLPTSTLVYEGVIFTASIFMTICEGDSWYCWVSEDATQHTCAQAWPGAGWNVTPESGPYDTQADCALVCLKWYCWVSEDALSHTCAQTWPGAGWATTPQSGPYDTAAECAAVCAIEPCPDCPGGTDPGAVITLTVAGVTNGTCTDCANANGAFAMTKVAPCVWFSADLTVCGVPCHWTVSRTAGQWQAFLVRNGGGTIMSFTLAAADCTLPATLPFDTAGGDCIAPVSVTLS